MSLAAFNDYDAIKDASAASFMNHDFAHADITARRRDEDFVLFRPSGWRPPEAEEVVAERARAVTRTMHDRHRE